MQRANVLRQIPYLTMLFVATITTITLLAPSEGAFGQELYLLSATPVPKSDLRFGSDLYHLDTRTGVIKAVRTVVSRDIGVDFVEADYERRLIVLAYPPVVPSTFVVLNMDAPANVLSVKIQGESNSVVASNYLLNIPGQGIVQALRIGDSPVDAQGRPINVTRPDRLVGVSLAGVSKRQEELPWNNILYVHCGGYSGTAIGTDDSLTVRAGSDGTFIRIGSTETLGIPIPPHLSPPPAKYENFKLWVNNNEIAVVSRGYDDHWNFYDPNGLYVFSKDNTTWRHVSISAGQSRVRGFDHWVAAIAAQPNHDHLQHSPGEEVRKAAKLHPAEGRRLPDTVPLEEFFADSNTYFPGELFLYNAKTGKSYTISTGQGDSEVVLATDSAVYYRVNDTLYRAAVNSDSLGKPELLAKDPVIFQVHWAFLSSTQ